MKKIIVSNLVSVDGYFAGSHGEIDWHNVDAEFNEYAIDMLKSVDTILFGRVTYDLMAGFWPTEKAIKSSSAVAELMNSLPKIVFSKNLRDADWNNTKVMNGIVTEEILKLKEGNGKDIVILGSGTIVSALTNLGLIDEYRIIINPVLFGKGKSMFAGIEKRYNLELQSVRQFTSGNVMLTYERK